MHPMLNTAVRAARAAGTVMLRASSRLDSLNVESKQRNDFVTEIDRQAEAVILDILGKAYPQHAFLGEETGRSGNGGSDFQWIIDPLDGTTNYLHGIPQYAISIALEHQGRLEQAVVYDPVKDELFTASRGGGAFLNSRRIRVTGLKSLDGALLGTGIPFRDDQPIEPFLATLRGMLGPIAGIRRAGSAALDLAYVAAGRLDGYWEFALKPWDMAAGLLLVREAGGMITDFAGGDNSMKSGNVIAANPRLLHSMLTVVQNSVGPEYHR
ncbi:MAG: inositol monophosphatase family protein [Pseudomonadota bacterium]